MKRIYYIILSILIISIALVLLSIFNNQHYYAPEISNKEKNAIENENEKLLEQAEYLLYKNPQKAISYANKVIYSAHNLSDKRFLSQAQLISGTAYVNYGDFLTGFEYVFDALSNCPEQSVDLKAKINIQLSSLYIYLKDLNRAFEYANKAFELSKEIKDSSILASFYNIIGLINIYVPDFDMAEKDFLKAMEINEKIGNTRGVIRNLNNLALYKSKDTKKTINQLYRAIELSKSYNEYWLNAELYNNLGVQYFYDKNYKKSIEALKEARENALKVNAKELLLDNSRYLADVYSQSGDYKNAYINLKSVLDEVETARMAEQIRNYQIELLKKRLEKERETADSKRIAYEKTKHKYTLFISVLAVFIIIVIVVYVSYRLRYRRKIRILRAEKKLESQRKELIAKKNQLVLLELAQKDIQAKNSEKELENIREQLTNTAFFVRSKTEMLTNIQSQIKEVFKLPEQQRIEKLKQIHRNISQLEYKNNGIGSVLDKLSHDFIFKLSEKYPNLTENEKRLASLLRVGFSTKEIAMIISLQPKSVDMARYRLRKKMGLDSDDSLQECLIHL